MRFFKENSGTIIKLIVNQLGIAIFAFFLYTAAGAIQSENGGTKLMINVAISAFATLFYFVLIYYIMWEIGGKDKIRIDGKRMERRPAKGMLIGLWANVPNIVIMSLALVFLVVYMMTGSDALMSAFAVLNAIFRIFVSMYLGILMGIAAPFEADINMYYLIQTLGFIVFSFISSLVIHFSYIRGLNDKRFFKVHKNSSDSKLKR